MDYIVLFVGILFFLELFEFNVQKSNTIRGSIEKLYYYYDKSIFLFFLIHPSFYFVIFIVLLSDNLNYQMLFILSFKIFDIFYKLDLIKRVYKTGDISRELDEILDLPISPILYNVSLFAYPAMLYFGLVN
jgi:hypothetical protein